MSGVSVSSALIAVAVSREDVAAGVSYNALSAASVVVQPQAAASYDSLVGAVSYAAPTFTLSYASIAIDAMLDYRGLYRKVREVVSVPDTALITLAKQFADTYMVADSSSNLVYKGFDEPVDVFDTVEIVKFFLRDFDETLAVSDTCAKVFEPSFADTTPVLDSYAFEIEKALEDAFGLNDGMGLNDGADFVFTSAINNVANVSDAAAVANTKQLADSVATADEKSISVALAASDTLPLSDAITASVSKSLSDTLSVSEVVSSIIDKALSDTASVADSATAVQSKSLSDSATVSTAGEVISQDYCDLTYFESNYVGEYRTFA